MRGARHGLAPVPLALQEFEKAFNLFSARKEPVVKVMLKP